MLTANDTVRALRRLQRRLRNTESTSPPIYVEDVFSPTYFGSTTAGVTTYSLQSGNWRRIGSVAILTGQVTWTNATGTGSARIGTPGNLPPGADSVGVVAVNGVTFANSTPIPIIQASGGGQLRLFSPLTNAAPTEVAIEVAGDIRFFICFFL